MTIKKGQLKKLFFKLILKMSKQTAVQFSKPNIDNIYLDVMIPCDKEKRGVGIQVQSVIKLLVNLTSIIMQYCSIINIFSEFLEHKNAYVTHRDVLGFKWVEIILSVNM